METPHPNEIKRLLVDLAIVRSVCEPNVLVFLHRHPLILLTSEQLAEFVGSPLNDIAKAREIFIGAGFSERLSSRGTPRRCFGSHSSTPQGVDVRR